jgi:hypothetical protein
MNRREFFRSPTCLGSLLASGSLLAGESTGGVQEETADALADKGGWISLFNGRSLEGWYTFLPSTGKNSDPKGVFKAEDGMIHILDIPVSAKHQEFGYLATHQELSNCRIHAEYKWGTKRFPPREEAKRDSGLLYHFVGPDKVWPCCLEFQIQETDTGDTWMVGGARATSNVVSDSFPMYSRSGVPQGEEGTFRAPAALQQPYSLPLHIVTLSGGRFFKDADFEDRTGWNSVELVLDGDRSTHIVNGRIVNRTWDHRQPDPNRSGEMMVLDRGRIMLQDEGAEIWFRNIKMKPLNSNRKLSGTDPRRG